MSDCNDTLRELELFLDSELSDDARTAIQSHLSGCTHCLETFDFHAELKTIIAAKCRNDELPPGLMSKIEQCFGDDLTSEQPVAGEPGV
jgi:anti-sigma factor (TIGR02949 family)